MKNSTYWKKRFNALANGQYRKSAGFVDQLQKKFDVTRRELEDKINSWYARFGANTGQVTLADAKKLLKADELEELHWTLKEYREYAKTHGLEPEWIDKLENASAKKHISRLESIKLQMEQLEEKLYAEYNNECYGYLGELVKDSYYRTAFEISKGVGIGTNLHRINEKMVEKYLTRPWCQDGKVFSDRIWTRKDEMIRTLDTELTKQLIIGSDPQKAIDKIADKFDVSKRQAGTLVMTESAAIASEASKDCMKDLGVEEYEISATLDSHTSEICQGMDGRHFKMSEYEPGMTAPPFHPNCRSTTVPYFDDEFTLDETRAARDKNDEGYERIPADMKYGEWKEKYIDGIQPEDGNVKTDSDLKVKEEKEQEPQEQKEKVDIAEEHEESVSSFTPVQTIEEAQLYAEQYIKQNFMDKTFKGKADFKGASLENVNAINKALTNVYEAFPDMEKISGIKVVSPTSAAGKKAFKDGADALFAYDPIQHGIYVNGSVLKNVETVNAYFDKADEAWNIVENNLNTLSGSQREIAERYLNAGRSLVANRDIEGLFEHEMGHHVEWTMLDAKTNNMLGSHMSEYAPQISGYATSSKSEYLAESFSAYMKGERDILDPQFVSFLDSKVKAEKIFALNADNLNVTWNLKLDESGKDVIIMTGKQFGKKAGEHVKDYGLDVTKEEDRKKFFEITQDIVQNHDEIRHGDWRGQKGTCDFYIKGEDVVVINNNKYVSTLKGGANNERVKNARK